MSNEVKRVNSFFKTAMKSEIDTVLSDVIFTDRQQKIFDMFYLKRFNIGFIADTLNVCPMVVNNDLKIIRIKLCKKL